METPVDKHRQALDLARRLLADDPRADLPMQGYAATAGDVAAHLVANAATRRGNARIDRSVPKLIEAGRQAIIGLSAYTTDRHARAGTYGGEVKGTIGTEWRYMSGDVYHYGHSWKLSASTRELHRRHPTTLPDLDECGRRFRQALRAEGVPENVVGGAYALIEKPEYGGDDEHVWTGFVMPMEDRRLDIVQTIVDIVHTSTVVVASSLTSHAKAAAAVHRHRDSLARMLDHAREVCMSSMGQYEHVGYESVKLRSVYQGRGKLADSVSIHATLLGLSEALTRREMTCVLTGKLGETETERSNLNSILEDQKTLASARRRLGRATVDVTGRAFMAAAGHDVAAMLDGIFDYGPKTSPRISAGKGMDAWFRITKGRITANVQVAPEARWKNDHLELKRQLPQAIMNSLAGRPATDVVDHPALEGATIRSVRTMRDRTLVMIMPRWEPL